MMSTPQSGRGRNRLGSPVAETLWWFPRARVQATNSAPTFPLHVLGMGNGVLGCRGDRGWFGNQALLDADDRDRLELQALHRVHGAGPDGLRAARAVQRGPSRCRHYQRLAGLPNQAGGPGHHANGLRLDP